MFQSQHALPTVLTRIEKQVPEFLTYCQVERQFSPETIRKYKDCLRQVGKHIGRAAPEEVRKEHVRDLKARLVGRGNSTMRQISILLAFKSYLRYCNLECEIEVDPAIVTTPRRPRPDVLYLTPAEVEQFVSAIAIKTGDGANQLEGLRFRALVECLLGSAMRISEALSLDRTDIDFDKAEARIVGKGSKPRTVFFTDRALDWIRRYLDARQDHCQAMFVTRDGNRLKRPDIWRFFERYRKLSGIRKHLTAHTLRHTTATQLLMNGCPIGHIKEILGHERLETTCKFYLGLDQKAAKSAHRKFMTYTDAP
jgi:integrase/recombinase XerD